MYKKTLFLIGLLVFGMIAPFATAADYEFPLQAGTGETEVKVYDEDEWEDIVGDNETFGDMNEIDDPTEIWAGDADEVGAKSKTTVLEDDLGEEAEWDVYDILDVLMSDWEDDINDGWEDAGLPNEWDDEDALRDLWDEWDDDEEWDVWEFTVNEWDFTDEEFDEDPDDEESVYPVFQDPEDGEDILEMLDLVLTTAQVYIPTWYLTYATLAAILIPIYGAVLGDAYAQGNATIAAIAAGDDALGDTLEGDLLFFWLIVDFGLPMASEIDSYLPEVMDQLDADDWEYNTGTNVLIGELEGEEDYIVKVTMSDLGVASKIEFMEDEDSEPFYVLEGSIAIPGYELPLLLAFTALSAIGLIYIVMKKK